MKKQTTQLLPGLALLLVSVIVGLFVCHDYGMAWDEPAQRLIGQVNYDYVFHHNTALLSFYDREYGAAFELPLILLEKLLHLTDLRDIYIARHLATHIFFLLSAFSLYVLALRLFHKQWLAILAFLMLVLMPRIYTHSFYNTKDIPFLSAIIIACTFSHAAFTTKKPLLFLAAGISSGYFMSIRIMGIIPLSFILFFLAWDIVRYQEAAQQRHKSVAGALLFIAGLCGCMYATWPLLWQHPVDNLLHCLEKLAHKEHPHGNLIIGLTDLPPGREWQYLPVWYAITVPLAWLFAGIAGTIIVAVNFAKRPLAALNDSNDRMSLIMLLSFAVPAGAVVLLHSAIYDEWRHLYFIYPPFIILSLYALNKALEWRYARAILAICALQLICLGAFMVVEHPYQYVYFNELVSRKPEHIRKNYELDYWGLSVQQALQHLVENTTGTIKVCDPGFEPYVRNNVAILPTPNRDRIKLCGMDECSYFITTYRYHPEDFPYPAVYKIQVSQSTIVCIYKVR